ncbi:unnamed protein product [Ectocarpus sp. CCAP 1310/34]|nr:unnamed protein product [Ectocarpus sp. CCAP 1310/34]
MFWLPTTSRNGTSPASSSSSFITDL